MKIIALLNFFNDDPDLLRRAVSSAVFSGATNVLAVDGPYANFPHRRTVSRPECWGAIMMGARDAPVTFYKQSKAWEGDEVAKRKFMLSKALEIADGPQDWLLILDSDYEWIVDDREEFLNELSMTEYQVAEVAYTENEGLSAIFSPARMLFRADSGLRMGDNHYTYLHSNGRSSDILCRASTEFALDLQQIVRVYHHNSERSEARADQQSAYYEVRDTQGLES